MAQSNNDMNGAAVVLVLIAMVFYALVIGFLIVTVFWCLVQTIICLFAWNKPLNIRGLRVYPDEARAYVCRGLLGLFAVPFVYIILCKWNSVLITDDGFWLSAVAGYVLGSLGIEHLLNKIGESAEAASYARPYTPKPLPPSRPQLPAPQPKPFRYASWDDEEDLRR